MTSDSREDFYVTPVAFLRNGVSQALFFRGADTTTFNHRLRGYIRQRLQSERDAEFRHAMVYEFLTDKNYESAAEFQRYKFLLNLPGRYPWSTRLKYLYLCRSFIINVRVFVKGDAVDDHYHSFIDVFVPDELCINVDMTFYYEDGHTGKFSARNEAECARVYEEIQRIYHTHRGRDPATDARVLRAYALVNGLTEATISRYFLGLCEGNAKLGIVPFVP